MGSVRPAEHVLHLVALFSAYPDAINWARDWCQRTWGPLALVSETFDFQETDYYTATMGTNLKKQFIAFATLDDPGLLPNRKSITNRAEVELAKSQRFPSPRPVNLDPGYLNSSKLVLASTKDHAHRLYLGEGIFGEITLRFRHGRWEPWEWTYPDYRRADYHAFFHECRDYYRRRMI